jgi:hypothetical protein
VPAEKTIRVVLDRLDPSVLARGLLGGRPDSRRDRGGRFRAACAATVPGARTGQVNMLASDQSRPVAVDGKTALGARHSDATRVHLLGVAWAWQPPPGSSRADVNHNETSHFTELLGMVDVADAVVTFGAPHTVRANLDWLVTDKKALHRDQTQPSAAAGQGETLF